MEQQREKVWGSSSNIIIEPCVETQRSPLVSRGGNSGRWVGFGSDFGLCLEIIKNSVKLNIITKYEILVKSGRIRVIRVRIGSGSGFSQ